MDVIEDTRSEFKDLVPVKTIMPLKKILQMLTQRILPTGQLGRIITRKPNLRIFTPHG